MSAAVSIAERSKPTDREAHLAVRAAHQLGFWTGLMAAVWAVWFIAAFAPWMAGLGVWQGIDAYVARFESLPYLGWVAPCLLLAVTFPIFLAAVHATTPPTRRVWSLIGLVFGAMYGGVLTTNYWLLASVVRKALEDRQTDGLTWLVIGSPHTINRALEGIGYAFMGIAALFVGFAFTGARLAAWTRWLFVANGIGGLIGFVAFRASGILPEAVLIIGRLGLGIWNIRSRWQPFSPHSLSVAVAHLAMRGREPRVNPSQPPTPPSSEGAYARRHAS